MEIEDGGVDGRRKREKGNEGLGEERRQDTERREERPRKKKEREPPTKQHTHQHVSCVRTLF